MARSLGFMTIERMDFARNGSEKEILHATLNDQRVILLWKLDGLTLEQATQPMTESGTNLFGLVKHLAWVERWWFCDFIDGQKFAYPWSDDDPDADFKLEEGEDLEWLRGFYAQCAGEADEVISRTDLEVTKTRGRRDPRSLRWVLVHMIEETARHAGHADILREQIDGTTGYYPPD